MKALKEKIINKLYDFDYYDIVNERTEEIDFEKIVDVVFQMHGYAEWYYDQNGMDWGLGAWKCSECHTKNDNLGGSKDINPYMFAGSKFCPQCGAIMKPKEK